MLSLFMIFIFLTSCFFRPRFYSAKPIEAWIVDEDTGKPLKDVVVVIYWELYGGMQPHPVGQLTVMETVTDKNGRFYFPAWGPKTTFRGYFRDAPDIILFKSGYKWRSAGDYYATRKDLLGKGPSIRISKWHGKSIELRKFKDSFKEYAKSLTRLSSMLGYKFRTQNNKCKWEKIPNMVVALHKQKAIFDKYEIYNDLYSIEGLAKMSPKSCGKSQSFFRSYM